MTNLSTESILTEFSLSPHGDNPLGLARRPVHRPEKTPHRNSDPVIWPVTGRLAAVLAFLLLSDCPLFGEAWQPATGIGQVADAKESSLPRNAHVWNYEPALRSHAK